MQVASPGERDTSQSNTARPALTLTHSREMAEVGINMGGVVPSPREFHGEGAVAPVNDLNGARAPSPAEEQEMEAGLAVPQGLLRGVSLTSRDC